MTNKAVDNKGSATVASVGIVLFVITGIFTTLIVMQAISNKNQNQTSADLSSISATKYMFEYNDTSSKICQIALETAQKNGSTLTVCNIDTDGVYVETKKSVINYIGNNFLGLNTFFVAKAKAGQVCR